MDLEGHQFFTSQLLSWYKPEQRALPWKAISNPYFIWLSEIILQQTRVEQGLPYYLKFIAAYPTVIELANAMDDDVMKLWEGLGYYSRARNMLVAARYIRDELQGNFPETYSAVLALKGVGPYTAAAVVSFAYNQPYAVVDGNVYRVLARYFNIDTPIDSTLGKKQFNQLAQQCLDDKQAGIYNQAIMDFGATLCKPQQPLCEQCPMQTKCKGLQAGTIKRLPIKEKKVKKRTRYFYFLEIHAEEELVLTQRVDKDIWQQLYQFPLIETDQQLTELSELEKHPLWQDILQEGTYELIQTSKPYPQQLTHQKIIARFLKIQLKEEIKTLKSPYFLHPAKAIKQFAFPKVIDWYLGDNSLYLYLNLL